MKPRFALPTLIITAGVAGLSLAAVAAPDTDNAPEAAAPNATAPSADNVAGFLGVAVAESVAPPDAGPDVPSAVLLISEVMPDSPADAAGLRSGDVLLKIDGQVLLHPVQFRRLVALQAPGQTLKLTILRHGQSQTLDATLGQRPDDFADQPDAMHPPQRQPFGQFEHIPFELHRGDFPLELQGDLQQMREQMDRQFEQMRQMFRQGMDDGWPGADMWEQADPIQLNFRGMPGAQQVTVLQDQDHKITITQNRDGRHLLATDLQGNVLFDGPIDTPEQLNAVPPALHDKLPAPGINPGIAPGQMRFELFPQLRPGMLQPQTPEDHEPGEQLPAPTGRAV